MRLAKLREIRHIAFSMLADIQGTNMEGLFKQQLEKIIELAKSNDSKVKYD